MPDEPLLREEARDAIRRGRLPTRPADSTWGGPGGGELCGVCGKQITKEQLEFEIEFNGEPNTKHHLHLRCFAAWEFERTKEQLQPQG